jgi:hypothetical protein
MPEKYQSGIGDNQDNVGEVSFNPLDEAVNEKSYTNASVNVQGVDLNTPIPEPRFTPPPIQTKAPPPPRENKPVEPVNSDMTMLSKKETKAAAEHAADMAINVYEWLHQLGNSALQVSDRKLAKLQSEGELNLNVMIQYDMGKSMRAGDFIQEYNQQVSGMLVVSDEFKEEVRPLLIEIFTKRGIGMTVEQRLAFAVAKDLGTKAFMFFQQKAVMNQMLNHMKEATTAANAQLAAATPPAASMQQATPQPQQQVVTSQPEVVEPTYGAQQNGAQSGEIHEPEEVGGRKKYETVRASSNGTTLIIPERPKRGRKPKV